MMLRIKRLRATTTLGVYEWEVAKKREIIVNAELEFDGAAAARSDDMKDAIDYSEIEQDILDHLYNHSFNLIETVASALAGRILRDPRISRVRVEVDKPGALRFAESVSVVEERCRR